MSEGRVDQSAADSRDVGLNGKAFPNVATRGVVSVLSSTFGMDKEVQPNVDEGSMYVGSTIQDYY